MLTANSAEQIKPYCKDVLGYKWYIQVLRKERIVLEIQEQQPEPQHRLRAQTRACAR